MSASPIRVFTIKQSAEFLALSVSTVRRLIREGRLPVIQLSERRLGITSDAIHKFVRANER
jgi:excisionase family DNA binding protein